VLPHIRLAQGFTPRPHDENIALGFTFSSFKKFATQFFVKRSAAKTQIQNAFTQFEFATLLAEIAIS